jgi:hypothetical protein
MRGLVLKLYTNNEASAAAGVTVSRDGHPEVRGPFYAVEFLENPGGPIPAGTGRWSTLANVRDRRKAKRLARRALAAFVAGHGNERLERMIERLNLAELRA